MRDSITGHIIFNDNQMTRGVDPRPVVLVESDSDLSILAPHFRDGRVRSAPGFAKSATLLAAELHLANGDDWVFAVVDRDLDVGPYPTNVVSTSHYDLESEIVFVCAIQVSRYCYSHIVSEDIGHEDAGRYVKVVREKSILLAAAIGAMRKHSILNSLGVSFASLPIPQIAQGESTQDYIEAAARFASLKAHKVEMQADLVTAAEQELAHGSSDPLCNGHDLTAAMCVLIGKYTGHRPSHRDFVRGMHASVDCGGIRMLSVFKPLQNWLRVITGEELWDCVA